MSASLVVLHRGPTYVGIKCFLCAFITDPKYFFYMLLHNMFHVNFILLISVGLWSYKKLVWLKGQGDAIDTWWIHRVPCFYLARWNDQELLSIQNASSSFAVVKVNLLKLPVEVASNYAWLLCRKYMTITIVVITHDPQFISYDTVRWKVKNHLYL